MVHVVKTLLPYIVLFYILDCFIYLKKFQIAFTTHFGGKFLYKKPGVCFIGISPFCRVLISMTRPIFFSQNGVYIWNKNELSDSDLYEFDSFYHVPFKDIANVECDGTRLTVNHNLSIDFYTSSVSKRIAEKILFLNSTRLARKIELWCQK